MTSWLKKPTMIMTMVKHVKPETPMFDVLLYSLPLTHSVWRPPWKPGWGDGLTREARPVAERVFRLFACSLLAARQPKSRSGCQLG